MWKHHLRGPDAFEAGEGWIITAKQGIQQGQRGRGVLLLGIGRMCEQLLRGPHQPVGAGEGTGARLRGGRDQRGILAANEQIVQQLSGLALLPGGGHRRDDWPENRLSGDVSPSQGGGGAHQALELHRAAVAQINPRLAEGADGLGQARPNGAEIHRPGVEAEGVEILHRRGGAPREISLTPGPSPPPAAPPDVDLAGDR